ncbi:MAG: hypothetical protein ABFD69_00375 [Candidatus Sumerlaeia bacterium]
MVFIYVMIGTLVFLSALEIARYRAASRGEDEMPYPRRRLIRRISISIVFVAILAALGWWPQMAPAAARLAYMFVVLLLALFGLALIWRELADTSRAAVQHTRAMNCEAARHLERMIQESQKSKSDQGN